MANVFGIHSVGNSLATFLQRTYPPELRAEHSCKFQLFSSANFTDVQDLQTTLSLYLYRVTMNEQLRNVARRNDSNVPLSVDLHFLLTIWADSVAAEHAILAWTMRQLYLHPMLNLSSLTPEASWGHDDVVHIIPAELTNEDMMRIWDAIEPSYRLSVSYIARAVRIDSDPADRVEYRPVVATRSEYRSPLAVEQGPVR